MGRHSQGKFRLLYLITSKSAVSLERLFEEVESPHYQVGDRVGTWLIIGQSYSFLDQNWYYKVVPVQVYYIPLLSLSENEDRIK